MQSITKFILALGVVAILAACADTPTTAKPQANSNAGKECVRKTGSNLCSYE